MRGRIKSFDGDHGLIEIFGGGGPGAANSVSEIHFQDFDLASGLNTLRVGEIVSFDPIARFGGGTQAINIKPE